MWLFTRLQKGWVWWEGRLAGGLVCATLVRVKCWYIYSQFFVIQSVVLVREESSLDQFILYSEHYVAQVFEGRWQTALKGDGGGRYVMRSGHLSLPHNKTWNTVLGRPLNIITHIQWPDMTRKDACLACNNTASEEWTYKARMQKKFRRRCGCAEHSATRLVLCICLSSHENPWWYFKVLQWNVFAVLCDRNF